MTEGPLDLNWWWTSNIIGKISLNIASIRIFFLHAISPNEMAHIRWSKPCFHLDRWNMWPRPNSTNLHSDFLHVSSPCGIISNLWSKPSFNIRHSNFKILPYFAYFKCSFIRTCWISIIFLLHRSIFQLDIIHRNMQTFKQFLRLKKLLSTSMLDQRNSSPPLILFHNQYRPLKNVGPTKFRKYEKWLFPCKLY